jgi:hypothetical protein
MSDEERTARFFQRVEEASAIPMGWKSRGSEVRIPTMPPPYSEMMPPGFPI